MSTNGFISFIARGETKCAYSHWDSGPHDLGLRVLHWLRSEIGEPDRLGAAIARLKIVRDSGGPRPTPEEVSRFHRYSDPGVGDPAAEWYAPLHGTQGDPAAILACGYVVYEDDPFGWIYEVNADEQSFSVSYDGDGGLSWPWSGLPADGQFLEAASQLDPNQEEYGTA